MEVREELIRDRRKLGREGEVVSESGKLERKGWCKSLTKDRQLKGEVIGVNLTIYRGKRR